MQDRAVEKKTKLSEIKKGDRAKVLNLIGPVAVVERLQELGVTRGAFVELVQTLTFGDPIVVDIDEVRLALRKSEAVCVEVQLCTGSKS